MPTYKVGIAIETWGRGTVLVEAATEEEADERAKDFGIALLTRDVYSEPVPAVGALTMISPWCWTVLMTFFYRISAGKMVRLKWKTV
jgi:hypothetical protein